MHSFHFHWKMLSIADEIVLLIAQNTVDEFIDFSLEQKHRVAQYAQMDSAGLSVEDMLMLKPEEVQNLIQAL